MVQAPSSLLTRYGPGDIEVVQARRSFPHFLEYFVYVNDPGTGLVKFEPWPHLVALARTLQENRLVVILKARQVGVSWLLAAYALWVALTRERAVVLMLSRGEEEAKALLGKVREIHAQLPSAFTDRLSVDSTMQLSGAKRGFKIQALPATKDAGRSETATLVIQDEADYHEYLAENYAAVKPTIDAGGQLVQASTSNKRKMDTLFKGLLRGAPANGFAKVFLPWTVRPGRDQAWYEAVRANVPPGTDLPPDLYMEQEYPSNEQEALSPSKALAFFDPLATTSMLDDCMEPRETRQGLVRIWRKPVVAGRYIGFGDVAWGQKGAYSCFVLADYATGEQVAEIYGRPALDEGAKLIYDLCVEYNRAWCGIEANGEGKKVVEKLVELGYGDRMYHRVPDWRATPDKRGWITGPSTRPPMLADLEEAVRLRRVIPRCREGVGEFMSFIRDEHQRPVHAEGCYDDHVMAWAGLWAIRPSARFSTFQTGRERKTPVRVHGRW